MWVLPSIITDALSLYYILTALTAIVLKTGSGYGVSALSTDTTPYIYGTIARFLINLKRFCLSLLFIDKIKNYIA